MFNSSDIGAVVRSWYSDSNIGGNNLAMLEHATNDAGDSVAQKLTNIAQYILVIAFGLLPIYFLPIASAPFIYTKVFVIVAAILLALVLYSFVLLRHGTFVGRAAWPIVALWLVAIASGISAVFSGDFRDAFIGNAFESHTVAFVGLLALVATTWMIIGTSKAAIMRLYMLLAISTLVLAVFHILRILIGVDFLTLGVFGGGATLSPIGTWNSLAVFFGLTIILSLVAIEQLPLSSWARALFAIVVVAALVMLAVINFFAVWVVLGLVSLVVLVYALTKGKFVRHSEMSEMAPVSTTSLSGASLVVSLATLITSIIFIIGGSAVGGAIAGMTGISYIEVRPSLEATVDIARDVYAESPVLGIGPNRFVDAWRLYRSPDINSTVFWNTDFQSGIGYIPTFFVTAGLLGGLLWIGFAVTFLVLGGRLLLRAPNTDRVWYFIGTSSFIAGLYLWGISFVYVPGPVLLLLAAMCTGLLYAAGNALMPEGVRTYVLARNQRSSFALVAVSIVFIIVSVGAVYGMGQHYAAASLFNRSTLEIRQGGSIDTAEELTARAFSLSPDDQYARRIAEYERARLTDVLATEGGTEELQTLFQEAFTNGVSAARAAVERDPNDPNNWAVLGALYAAVVPLNLEGAYEQAETALERARSIDPQSPSRILALAQLAFLNDDLTNARTRVEEAIRLKSNYTDAIYFLAQVDIAAGNIEAAIASTRSTTVLEPQNPVRHFQLGVLQLSNDSATAAATSLERAVALNANYANARYFLAFAYDRLGRTEDAIAQLQRVLELNPGNQQVVALIERLNRGESIVTVPSEEPESTEPPIEESDEEVESTDPVTSGEAPDSPLLTPVNTETNQEEGGVE